MHRAISQLSLFIALLLGCLSAAGAISIPFTESDGFILVEVAVPGESNLTFAIDTGANVTVVDSSVADRLKLHGGGKVNVKGVGAEVKGRWPVAFSAGVSGRALPDKVLVTDLCALNQACNCRIDGLLGLDFLAGRSVEFDFQNRKLILDSPAPITARSGTTPLRKTDAGLFVRAFMKGTGSRWVRLDTGCVAGIHAAGDGKARIGGLPRKVTGLVESSAIEEVGDVQVAGFDVERVDFVLHTKPVFKGEDGLLGLGVMRRFDRMRIDYAAGLVIFAAR